MTAKYFAALLATALVSLSAYGADKLIVIFPDTTNLVFTVPINDKIGERQYDCILKFPDEYDDEGRFPITTNLVFTVPINGKTGERPYDFFLEFPDEYDDEGRPTKYERTGLGYYISVEVIEETADGVRCKLKVDCHRLSDWIPYTFGELVVLQPVLTSLSTDTEITLPIGEWYPPECIHTNKQFFYWKFLFQREEQSQQSVPGYPPQSVGSPEP